MHAKRYIYQNENWPTFTWDDKVIAPLLGEVRYVQGRVAGQMDALGFSVQAKTSLEALTNDVLRSSEIEGVRFNYDAVRSSLARRLGLDAGGAALEDRNIEGAVAMTFDAVSNHAEPLTEERLFGWHAALFPTGHSGMHRIAVGAYRTEEMQIVSGAIGRERVHYTAPPPSEVPFEMTRFLAWFNGDTGEDSLLKAAIAHFWFVIIHPFDDGNGRIARALSDLLLARAENSVQRYYSLSSRILQERKEYYRELQDNQSSIGDITTWLTWFLGCLGRALRDSEVAIKKTLRKARFWSQHEHTEINSRQRLLLNKLLDGFEGKLQTSKWAKIAKCSSDTALRDIQDLIAKGILQQDAPGGRSISYSLDER